MVGALEGTSTGPITLTPPTSTVLPGRLGSTLPPCSAARSTTTEPGLMASTISAVIRTGALAPCTWAVVITTSLAATVFSISSRWRARASSLIAVA